ncbi:MAG: hypothetical protein JWL59_2451 [Chthoniobacteraceae bacterium]|nr:hypothetical protein [Chthoniobacteraceae bacterium]
MRRGIIGAFVGDKNSSLNARRLSPRLAHKQGVASAPMSSPNANDVTPIVSAAASVSPGGNQSAANLPDGPINAAHWDAIAASAEFKALLRAKVRFIVPATIFFVVYYFALPYLVGYQPQLMEKKVWGSINIAYLFALSQFFMAWGIALLYVFVAAGWDRTAAELIRRFAGR